MTASLISTRRRRHGDTIGYEKTFEYRVWRGMISRCHNSRVKSYKDYGAKGVSVCERWRRSFAAFLEDMGRAPTHKHSIDRYPNRRGHYEPRNCRWANSKQQRRNMDNVTMLTMDEQTRCVGEWGEITGIPRRVLYERVVLMGWDHRRALTTPTGTRASKLNWDSVREIRKLYAAGQYSLSQLASRFHVGVMTVHDVVKNKTWIEM